MVRGLGMEVMLLLLLLVVMLRCCCCWMVVGLVARCDDDDDYGATAFLVSCLAAPRLRSFAGQEKKDETRRRAKRCLRK